MLSQTLLFIITCLSWPQLHSLPAVSQWRHSASLRGPSNQTVTSGSRAVLSCEVSPGTKCHWLKDGFLVDYRGRYQPGSGPCDLVIDPVLALDQGDYQCQVGGRNPMTSNIGRLSVDTEPGRPRIKTSEDVVMVEVGDEVDLECQSTGGRPAGQLDWWNADTGEQIISEVTTNVHRAGESFTTTSRLRFEAKGHMKIYCTVHSEAFSALKQSDPVEISIRGQPRVESIALRQGDSVKVFCHNRQVEDVLKFRWFINDKEIFDENKDVLEITDFTRAYDKSVVKCVVADQSGKDTVVRAVELLYNAAEKERESRKIVTTRKFDDLGAKPKAKKIDVMLGDMTNADGMEEIEEDDAIMEKPESAATDNKKKTTFICVVEDESQTSGEPKYVWVDGKLTMNSQEDASADKKYKCKVIKNGYKKMNKMAKDLKNYSKSLRRMNKFLTDFSK